MLFIKNLREDDSGRYRCEGIYASNEEMKVAVQISTFSELSDHQYWLLTHQANAKQVVISWKSELVDFGSLTGC